ncbi:hypothetical protein [Streptomyces sp. NPDC087300]|uniref:hypothetical protein n=1 Tax=Streptomyces sp. NPDC087300 TaxID=3365780 RepID=UPI0037FCAA63
MKNVSAHVLFYVVSRAPQIAAFLVGTGLLTVLAHLSQSGAARFSPWTGLMILCISLLGVLAVGLACALPVLRTTDGGRRTVEDACMQGADRVGDWADWEPAPPRSP